MLCQQQPLSSTATSEQHSDKNLRRSYIRSLSNKRFIYSTNRQTEDHQQEIGKLEEQDKNKFLKENVAVQRHF